MCFSSLATRLLHCADPETAHRLAIAAMRTGMAAPFYSRGDAFPRLHQKLWGIDFPNPLGLAAGFDKNAEASAALLKLGFGFVEAGTVTLRPQVGNPKPRLFRLREDEAIINRLGFNNHGIVAFIENVKRARSTPGIIGINIGKNKDSADAVEDYTALLRKAYPFADYITVNISSPNTEGLRALQQREALDTLLQALNETRDGLIQDSAKRVPLLIKIAPDIARDEEEAIAETILARRPDGLIISNTTIARPETLHSSHRSETGGLSGRPLRAPAAALLARMYALTGGAIPLIGVGGIGDGAEAYARIRAGASLVQFYTAFIYKGPPLVRSALRELDALLQRDGFASVAEAVGADAR